jgi:hypothetical protein
MVLCVIVHTIFWWKWAFYCIMSWFLTVMTYHWSSTSSKTSSFSSSPYVACSISSRCVILRRLIILCGIVLRLCYVVLWLCVIVWLLRSIILLLCNVVWSWNLIKMWCNLSSHHFFLHSICILFPFSHQLHGSTIFVIVAH